MIIQYGDAAGWSPGEFANFAAALTNGIQITHRFAYDDSVILDLCDGLPIKENHHWTRFCFDGSLESFGTGDDYFTVRWSLIKAGRPLVIRKGELLAFDLSDDLSGLVSMTVNLQGFYP